MKKLLKQEIIRPIVQRLCYWTKEEEEKERNTMPLDTPFDNTYEWLVPTFFELRKDRICSRKPFYIWGVAQAVALAGALHTNRILVIEFGVAGGGGCLRWRESLS
jgi:hypothetical protein